jgi:hypothetical protein
MSVGGRARENHYKKCFRWWICQVVYVGWCEQASESGES